MVVMLAEEPYDQLKYRTRINTESVLKFIQGTRSFLIDNICLGINKNSLHTEIIHVYIYTLCGYFYTLTLQACIAYLCKHRYLHKGLVMVLCLCVSCYVVLPVSVCLSTINVFDFWKGMVAKLKLNGEKESS